MDKITFDLVSPERLLLSEDAEMVTIPGTEGDMGVMLGHMPLISTLRPGVIAVVGGAKGNTRFYVTGGFAEVTPERLTVLAEEAVPVGELNAAKLENRIQQAEETLAASGEAEKAKAQEILDSLKVLRTAH
jgi:F-type H+-transporting ATPase subunit epsilon